MLNLLNVFSKGRLQTDFSEHSITLKVTSFTSSLRSNDGKDYDDVSKNYERYDSAGNVLRKRRRKELENSSSKETKSTKNATLLEWWNATEEVFPETLHSHNRDNSNISVVSDHYDNERKLDKLRCHKNADSLFTSSSGFVNYRGMVNFGFILLALGCSRVAMENLMKYGILIDPITWFQVFLHNPYSWPNLSLVIGVNLFILFAFYLEIKLSNETISENVAWYLHSINLFLVLVLPAAVILYLHPNPACSLVALGIYTVVFLKLVSYKHVNKWCRESKLKTKKFSRTRNKSVGHELQNLANGDIAPLTKYPDNLTLKDLYYFLCAPTLCYELNFPKSGRIRKRFLLKRIAEMVLLTGLIISLVQQWIIPTVLNSKEPFVKMDVPKIVARVLKLAIPNIFIWLMWFYWLFHSSLNVIAELLHFGDRVFYRDWWNAETVQNFWQNWNIPVHKWASRHLYKPLLNKGCSRMQANVAVFVLSAFFHEYLVSVPLGMFRLWAFMGMLMQVPLAILTAKYLTGVWGNVAVWISLIIGQPVAILMYYVDYYLMNYAD